MRSFQLLSLCALAVVSQETDYHSHPINPADAALASRDFTYKEIMDYFNSLPQSERMRSVNTWRDKVKERFMEASKELATGKEKVAKIQSQIGNWFKELENINARLKPLKAGNVEQLRESKKLAKKAAALPSYRVRVDNNAAAVKELAATEKNIAEKYKDFAAKVERDDQFAKSAKEELDHVEWRIKDTKTKVRNLNRQAWQEMRKAQKEERNAKVAMSGLQALERTTEKSVALAEARAQHQAQDLKILQDKSHEITDELGKVAASNVLMQEHTSALQQESEREEAVMASAQDQLESAEHTATVAKEKSHKSLVELHGLQDKINLIDTQNRALDHELYDLANKEIVDYRVGDGVNRESDARFTRMQRGAVEASSLVHSEVANLGRVIRKGIEEKKEEEGVILGIA